MGCSECYASGWRLVELRNQYFPGTEFSELFTQYAAVPELAAYVDEIACAIAAEVNILDPEYIVLGGGVLNMKGFPMEALKTNIYRHRPQALPGPVLDVLSVQRRSGKRSAGRAGAGLEESPGKLTGHGWEEK